MVAITYSGTRAAAPAAVAAKTRSKTGKKARGFFARVVDAVSRSQMIRAERELARYRHLLPLDFELNTARLWSRSEDGPLGGW
jgi:hypothetical protein